MGGAARSSWSAGASAASSPGRPPSATRISSNGSSPWARLSRAIHGPTMSGGSTSWSPATRSTIRRSRPTSPRSRRCRRSRSGLSATASLPQPRRVASPASAMPNWRCTAAIWPSQPAAEPIRRSSRRCGGLGLKILPSISRGGGPRVARWRGVRAAHPSFGAGSKRRFAPAPPPQMWGRNFPIRTPISPGPPPGCRRPWRRACRRCRSSRPSGYSPSSSPRPPRAAGRPRPCRLRRHGPR